MWWPPALCQCCTSPPDSTDTAGQQELAIQEYSVPPASSTQQQEGVTPVCGTRRQEGVISPLETASPRFVVALPVASSDPVHEDGKIVVLEPKLDEIETSASADTAMKPPQPSADTAMKPSQPSADSATKPSQLHIAIWDSNLTLVRELLAGNPNLLTVGHGIEQELPLQFAARLLRRDMVQCLLEAQADLITQDCQGWKGAEITRNAFRMDETGLLADIAGRTARQRWQKFASRSDMLAKELSNIPDCDVTLTWNFTTWVPLAGRLLPSDEMRMRKRGSSLLFDYSLKGFSGMSWQHGRYSLLVIASTPAIYFINHEEKKLKTLEQDIMERDSDEWNQKADRRRRYAVTRGELNFSRASIKQTVGSESCGSFQGCKVFEITGVQHRKLELPIPPGFDLRLRRQRLPGGPLVNFARSIGMSRSKVQSSEMVNLNLRLLRRCSSREPCRCCRDIATCNCQENNRPGSDHGVSERFLST